MHLQFNGNKKTAHFKAWLIETQASRYVFKWNWNFYEVTVPTIDDAWLEHQEI